MIWGVPAFMDTPICKFEGLSIALFDCRFFSYSGRLCMDLHTSWEATQWPPASWIWAKMQHMEPGHPSHGAIPIALHPIHAVFLRFLYYLEDHPAAWESRRIPQILSYPIDNWVTSPQFQTSGLCLFTLEAGVPGHQTTLENSPQFTSTIFDHFPNSMPPNAPCMGYLPTFNPQVTQMIPNVWIYSRHWACGHEKFETFFRLKPAPGCPGLILSVWPALLQRWSWRGSKRPGWRPSNQRPVDMSRTSAGDSVPGLRADIINELFLATSN